MHRSIDRILTTHTGSLPRPMDLSVMLEDFDSGESPDQRKFESRVREAVAEVVKVQVDSGVDVVSDGEQGKVGYSTYVRHRLTGFEGEGSATARSDWADFPEAIARLPRPSTVSRPACDGPIDWKDREAVQRDIANFKAAVSASPPAEAFMTAASPGVIAHFLLNRYFPTREAYLARLADVMKEEYNAIHQAGFLLQVDCPDLAMARHLMFPDISNQDFVKIAEANVEALNHALSDIPPEASGCTCVGATTKDPIIGTSPSTKSSARCSIRGLKLSRSRGRIRATSTNGKCSRTSSFPTARSSSPVCWTPPPTTSSIPN